jgi:hypothetical protein
MKKWLCRVVLKRLWLTFIVLGLSFFAFGFGTLNLFYTLSANIHLIAEHGWQAIMDGGAQQFIEMMFVGYASLAAYVVFKACEYRLAHWLTEEH